MVLTRFGESEDTRDKRVEENVDLHRHNEPRLITRIPPPPDELQDTPFKNERTLFPVYTGKGKRWKEKGKGEEFVFTL